MKFEMSSYLIKHTLAMWYRCFTVEQKKKENKSEFILSH